MNGILQALGGDLFRTNMAMHHSLPLTTRMSLLSTQEENDPAMLAT
jgi:hypothetical protein